MPPQLGYQFAPGADLQQQQGGPGQRHGMSPQEAVKLLQLRIPERPAAGGIAPQALLQAPGGAGAPGGGSLQALIRALLERQTGQPGQGGGGGPQMGGGGPQPLPRIHPILPPGQQGPLQPTEGFNVDPGLVQQMLNRDLGGGRTLAGGGGAAGNWRGRLGTTIQNAPPLF